MRIKSLLIVVFTLLSFGALAQTGGLKGKVVSRDGRVAIDGARVVVSPGDRDVMTDNQGNFVFDGLENGEYTLTIEAPEF